MFWNRADINVHQKANLRLVFHLTSGTTRFTELTSTLTSPESFANHGQSYSCPSTRVPTNPQFIRGRTLHGPRRYKGKIRMDERPLSHDPTPRFPFRRSSQK